jgi:hypothetical protein
MNPYKIIGVAIVVLAVFTALLWQANQLIQVGAENASLKVLNQELEHQLTVEAQKARETLEKLREDISLCNAHVDSVATVGETWRSRYEALRRSRPRTVEVPVEIESTDCISALMEAHVEVGPNILQMIQEVHHGGP